MDGREDEIHRIVNGYALAFKIIVRHDYCHRLAQEPPQRAARKSESALPPPHVKHSRLIGRDSNRDHILGWPNTNDWYIFGKR